MPTEVEPVPGSLRRVSQLTGEWVRGRDGSRTAQNAAECRRVALEGTDLGASFFDGTRIWFLFGDTTASREPSDTSLSDAVAWTTDLDPGTEPRLRFVGNETRQPRFTGGAVPTGIFEVPTGGFASDSAVYVFFSTDHSETEVMGRSVLGRGGSVPFVPGLHDPSSLTYLYDVSVVNDGGRFINVAPVVERGGHPGLPFPGGAVLMWGSGRYRDSDVYLAAVPLDGVEERDAWWYWRGDVPGASPWSGDEADAAPLFAHPEVGELSVAWIGPIQRWMMTYNARHPDGIVYRTAPKPWGPWTAPQLLYDPYGPLGFGTMIHGAWADGDLDGTDLLYDRGRGEEGGAAYGGYIVDRYTRRIDGETAEVFFALSTWNPYQVTLMAAQLRLVQTVTAEVFVKIGEDPGTVTASTGQGVHHARVGTRLGAAVDSGPHLAAGTQASASVEKITAHLVTGRDRTRVGVEDEQRTVDPLLGERPRGALALVQSTFGAKQRNFELVVPRVGGGLLLRAADNDGDVPAWRSVVTAFGGGDPPPVVGFEAVAMALSPVPDLGNGDDPGQRRRDRLIVVGVTGDRLAYLWRDREAPWPWRGPYPVIAVEPDDRRIPLTGVRGNPTLIPSTFGDRRQNFQLVVPDARAGIRHIWMDHDQPFPLNPDWRLAPTFAATLGQVDAVTMIQSTFLDGDRGHLEAVIRRGGELHFCWRGRAGWSDPFPIVADGSLIDGAIGVPALVQGGQGTRRRNFELVTPLAAGGLGAYSLDNDPDEAGLRRWHGPVVTDPGTRYDAVAMIQGPFGAAPGNLEVAASTADGRVVHLWRNALTQAWSNPAPLIPA